MVGILHMALLNEFFGNEGLRVSGFGFRVQGFGLRASGFGCPQVGRSVLTSALSPEPKAPNDGGRHLRSGSGCSPLY